MTHEDLRKRAVQWLTNTKHCSVVLSEMHSLSSEIPDALGFTARSSIVVECKVSRSDFCANKNKPNIRAGTAVGELRYFLTPRALIKADEVLDPYGLLWLSDTYIHVQKQPVLCTDVNLSAERTMLVSALRRVRTREFLTLNICPCENCNELQELSA